MVTERPWLFMLTADEWHDTPQLLDCSMNTAHGNTDSTLRAAEHTGGSVLIIIWMIFTHNWHLLVIGTSFCFLLMGFITRSIKWKHIIQFLAFRLALMYGSMFQRRFRCIYFSLKLPSNLTKCPKSNKSFLPCLLHSAPGPEETLNKSWIYSVIFSNGWITFWNSWALDLAKVTQTGVNS